MQHPDEGTIHAWLDGALSADEGAQIEAHVKDCAECAATVAEARGFIAASSRILTALDNAPRGVIPAAAPVKRRLDPMAWRIAASVLVIAGGTLLVVRSQGTRETSMAARLPTMDSSTSTAALNAAVESSRVTANAPALIAPPRLPAAGPVRRATPAAVGTAGGAKPNTGIGSRGDLSGAAAPRVESSAPMAQKSAAPATETRADRVVAVPAPGATSRFLPPASAIAGQGVAADAIVGPTEPLKVIGSPRRVGANVTVYEIAGDTVTLTESMQLQLRGVVATGAATTRVQGEKAAAARTNSAEPAAAQTATAAGGSPRVPAPPTAATSVPVGDAAQPGDANAVHTITWVDPVTRNTLTLSGRMSEAQLQLIRVRIESERAAAKKTP
jgi:hypothetical protein